MKSLRIPLHSFVDLITNSSSEIFVQAHDKTIVAVKEVINNLLKGVGSDKTADDLFTIELGIEVDNPESYEERKISGKGYTVMLSTSTPEGAAALKEKQDDYEYPAKTDIIVTPKDGTNENLVLAARTLSDLTGLFSIDSRYNG